MKRSPRRFAVCLDNAGSEASLILGKVYRIVPDVRAAKDDLLRVIDESGEDYLFARRQFAFVNLPQAARRRIIALERSNLRHSDSVRIRPVFAGGRGRIG